jgi:nitrite reductase/ring-hydroxylating ferredoxin subunit
MSEIKPIYLCKIDDIPINGTLGFDPFEKGHNTVFVVNTKVGPVAYKDICPHYGTTTLPWRKNNYLNSAATKIICAAHGAEFEINSGLCVSGPCLGQSLITVPLIVCEDGSVLASIDKKGNEFE